MLPRRDNGSLDRSARDPFPCAAIRSHLLRVPQGGRSSIHIRLVVQNAPLNTVPMHEVDGTRERDRCQLNDHPGDVEWMRR